LNEPQQTIDFTLTPVDNRRLAILCGHFDEHLKQIEHRLNIEVSNRGHAFHLTGVQKNIQTASRVLKYLYQETARDHELTPIQIHLALQQFGVEGNTPEEINATDPSPIKMHSKQIKARTPNQKHYIENILSHDVNFGIGPAGTGKTFLAVATAVAALEQEKIRRIVLVRPAVEAGERLGFLPGDLAQKIDPYLRPLYDSLYELLGFERVSRLLERQTIEIASLAYMRGRTLNDAFIILDEAQNTTIEQMKMFLTRLGFSSTAVITGDITQIDLPKGKQSGLKHVLKMLQSIPRISFTFFQSSDVVRHPVVQEIIEAYEAFEKKQHPTGEPDEY
jgi:phosphate starvation-inducible PhoH-like protein